MSRLSTPGPGAPFARQGHRGPLPPCGSLLRRRLRSLGRHALAAALALAVVATALPVQAKDPIQLVSTVGQASSTSPGTFERFDSAQAFTTGTDTNGYKLTSVDLHLYVEVGTRNWVYSVSVWSATATGSPDTSLGTLTIPAFTVGAYSNYTYPSVNGIDLEDSTTYVIVVDVTTVGTGNKAVRLENTTSDNEDTLKAIGWSIADGSLYRNWDSTAWKSFDQTRKIRVNGYAKSDTPNTPATGAPTITGTAQVGETLTAVTTGIMDVNGLTSPTYTYQWIRVNGMEADIASANSSTYTLLDADLGKTLKVRVSFEDDDDYNETLTSAATATVFTTPKVTNADVTSSPASGDLYGTGEKIQFTVTFDHAVTVTGTPEFEFCLGTGSCTEGAPPPSRRRAPLLSGSDTTALVFSYTVVAGEVDDNGIWAGNQDRTIKLDMGDTIQGTVGGFDAVLTHPAVGTKTGHKVAAYERPHMPPSFTVTEGGGRVKLTWAAANDGGGAISRYQFRHAPGSTVPDSRMWSDVPEFLGAKGDGDPSNETEVLVTGLENGTQYAFQVRAVNGRGGGTPATATATPMARACDMPNTAGRRIIWTGTLGVEGLENGAGETSSPAGFGFDGASSTGSLIEPGFAIAPNDYTIVAVRVPDFAEDAGDGNLLVRFQTGNLTDAEQAELTLHVCDADYAFQVATHRAADHEYEWADTLDWSLTGSRQLRLSLPATNAATGMPTISGVAEVGALLSADATSIADLDGLPDTFSYQWVRVDANGSSNPMDIPGAIRAAYILTPADAGKRLRVKVSFTDKQGTLETQVSDAWPSGDQILANAMPTSSDKTVTIEEDTVYTFMVSDFAFSDGDTGDALASVRIVTLPQDGSLALDGAPATADGVVTKAHLDSGLLKFTPAANAHGTGHASFAFRVSDGLLESDPLSTMTIDVTAANDPTTGLPVIWGTPRVGRTLTASTSEMTDPDGLPSTFVWQWVRVDSGTDEDITSAASHTYMPVAADVGKQIKVTVSFTDNDGTAVTLTSASTRAVAAAATAGNATGRPALSAEFPVQTVVVTASTSDITDSDGVNTSTIEYEWLRCNAAGDSCVTTIGAGSTYTLAAGDVGVKIRVRVSFSDDDGNFESVTSNPLPPASLARILAYPACAESDLMSLHSVGRKVIWTGTMTVGRSRPSTTVTEYGYKRNHVGNLSPSGFTSGSRSYLVDRFVSVIGGTNNGDLSVGFLTGGGAAVAHAPGHLAHLEDDLRLHACNQAFPFGRSQRHETSSNFIWSRVRVAFVPGSTRLLRMSVQTSNDATLSGLSLSDGTLSPSFSPTQPDYTATVVDTVVRVTVTPVTSHAGATVAYLDADDMPLADADTASADTFEFDLAVGDTVVKVKVTADDGATTQIYTATVTRQASTDATLSGLSLSNGTLSPNFSREHTDYTATVGNTGPQIITVTPVTNHAGATVAYLDADDVPLADADTASADTFEVDLTVGANVVKVKVTAENGTATKTYTVTVTRQASNDATLSGLYLGDGTLSPGFSPTRTDYTATVGNTVVRVTVTPVTNHAGATVAYLDADDMPLADADTASADTFEVDLTVGANVVKVKVTAENGTAMKTYTVTVTRQGSNDATLSGLSLSNGTLSPMFSSTQPDYTATVGNTGPQIITVTPATNHPGATVAYLDADDVPLADADTASADTFEVDLTVGANVVKVKVTAENGTATETYTVTITRQASNDATLSGLSLSDGTLSPAFSREHTSYTATVVDTVVRVTVTPVTNHAGATLEYLDADDMALADADTASADAFEVDLAVGANVVKVKVTAEDSAATKTYTVTVTRQASTDATLSGLSLSGGTLSPNFSPTHTDYAGTVEGMVSRVTVTPVTNHPSATLEYLDADDMALADADTASADTFEVDLPVRANVVKVKVTAENGTATKTYTVTVTRPASNDATLSGLSLGNGTLSPNFSPEHTSYAATVVDTVVRVTVTPVTNHAGAAVAYLDADDMALADADTASADTFEVDLAVGANVVKVKVTAENGTAMKTYTVTVTRQASNDATLSGLSLSNGTLSPMFSSTQPDYTATVGNTGPQIITVTPATNHAGATVAYLDADDVPLADADTASADTFEVDLTVGETVVKVKVTAENGTATETYTVTITRQASNDATLSGLSLSDGTLSPAFSPEHTSYAATVEDTVVRVTVTPETNHAGATIEYLDADDMALADADTASADAFEVDLAVGANVVKVKVTAEDSAATKTYTVTVTRQASTDATLSGLSLSGGTLSPNFSPTHTDYAGTVEGMVSRVTVTPVTNHPSATLEYLDEDDMALADADTASADTFEVDLADNETVFKVKVTAEDDAATKTYIVTVTRVSLRLRNGTGAHEGRVEIFQQGQWGTICDDDWTDVEAGVVCRSLGFALGAVDNLGRIQDEQGRSLPPLYFGPAAAGVKMWLDNVNCKGNETNLLDCPRRGNTAVGVHNCKPNEAVGVQCRIVPKVKSVAVSPASGPYAAGGTLRVTVEWNHAVVVTTPAGGSAPKLMVGYDTGGVIEERDAVYASGSGTAALVFEHTLAGGDSFDSVKVLADTLLVRDGAIVWKTDKVIQANLAHDDSHLVEMTNNQLEVAVPVVVGAPVLSEAGTDGFWTAGEKVEVQLTFSGEVTVNTTAGTPSIGLLLGDGQARSAEYTSGSGTAKLVFAYTLVEGDGPHDTMLVTGDSLALNDGTIVSTADSTVAADLAHVGAGRMALPQVAISVADATVREAAGAVLAFVVTLDRAQSEAVAVDYATVPGTGAGVATEGSDYTATSGTLTFAANETSKTVEVPVLADEHDEDSETMTLTLTNPVGARIADGEATGTIENTGPIPQAWTARFGRTVADQVLDAVDARLRAARAAGVSVSLGGQRLGGSAPRAHGQAAPADGPNAAGTSAGEPGPGPDSKPASAFGAAADAGETARLKALSDWLRQETAADDRSRGWSRTLTGRQMLMGSSFSLAAETAGGGFAGLWGRMAQARFAGREDALSLDGDVTTGLLGADYAWGRWRSGLVVSHSIGEGGYRGDSAGEIEATVTALTPWAGYRVTEGLSVWGAAGYGAGGLKLTPGGDPALKTDLGMMLAAAGARGTLVGGEGPKLDAVTDARWVRTTTARVSSSAGNLASASASVTRLRLGLEGSWPLALGDGVLGKGVLGKGVLGKGVLGKGVLGKGVLGKGVLGKGVLGKGATVTPRLALGVRHDGGDAETGFGADIGGGVTLAAPAEGLTVSLDGRGVLTHEASGLRDRGIAGTLAWNPPSSTGRGPKLTLSQTFGAGAASGKDALLSRTTLEGLAANDNGAGQRRLEARFGYGFGMFGGRFTGTPEIGLGFSDAGRDYSLGWRLTRAGSLELSIDATRRDSANDNAPPEHGIGATLTARF